MSSCFTRGAASRTFSPAAETIYKICPHLWPLAAGTAPCALLHPWLCWDSSLWGCEVSQNWNNNKKTQKTRKLSYPKVGFLTQFTGQSHHQLGLFISTIEQEEIWGMEMGLRWGWGGGSGNFSNLTFPWRKWLCNCRWWLCCTRLMHPEGLSWCSSGKRMQLPLHWAQDVSVSKGRL